MNTQLAGYARTVQTAGSGSDGWLAFVAFVTPTLLLLDLVVVGRIFAPEIVLLGLLPFLLLARGRMLADPLPRTFLALLALWLAGQVVTDLVRETEFRDYARGWSRIVFTALNFCALYLLLYGSRRRLVLFVLGLAAGGFLSYAIVPSEFARVWPWKFGIGTSTALLAALVAMWRPIVSIPLLPALPLVLTGAYSAVVGARALAGVALVAAFYILVQQVLGQRGRASARPSARRVLVFCAAGAVLATLLLQSYEVAVEAGLTREHAARVTERQREGAFGLLVGGRSEIFASTRAVMDSPILGHGSWAKNPDYAARILDARIYGYDVHYTSRLSDLIPTHSHVMGAWVEAGLLGAFVWLWAIFLILRVLANLYPTREPLGPLVAFIGLLMLWDILFSPLGAERRLTMPFNLVLMMSTWDALRAGLPRAGPPSARNPLRPLKHPQAAARTRNGRHDPTSPR